MIVCSLTPFNEYMKQMEKEYTMSKDNGIYILKTTDSYKIVNGEKKFLPNKVTSFRVAHISAIDNFGYFEKQENMSGFYNYLKREWGNGTAYYTIEEALICASRMYDKIGYIEYGICKIDGSQYDFFEIRQKHFISIDRLCNEKKALTWKQNKINKFLKTNPDWNREDINFILAEEQMLELYIANIDEQIEHFKF